MTNKGTLVFRIVIICVSLKTSFQISGVALSNDFEAGSFGEWELDECLPGMSDAQWKIEDVSENLKPLVPPTPGNLKYLRVSRSSPGISYGLTAIRSSYVTVNHGDKITFDYWLKSRYHGFNNILVDNTYYRISNELFAHQINTIGILD